MRNLNKIMHLAVIIVFLCGITSFFSSCSDDMEEILAKVELPSNVNLMELEQWSYSIPFEIKSDSEWEIDFLFDDGRYLCYAYPNKGIGDATVKICVLDNWTDKRRSGEMYITFPKDESKNQVIKLSQKCNLDNDENLTEVNDGDRIYAVGYGYNFLGEYASANSVSINPIVMIESCSDKVHTGGVNASFEAKTYSGSSITELMNELSADAKFEGKYSGFKGEVGATFGMSDFSNNNHEYAISYVEVAQQSIFLEMNRDQIIMDYMTDAAYEAINGLPHKGKRGEIPTSYPLTPEGMKKLVQDYGTHLILKARLGGKLKYRMTVDVSKVEGSYDLKAFANCSYNNKYINASANVADSLHESYKQNSKACEIKVLVQGGGKSEAQKLGIPGGDNDTNIEAWQNSLVNVKNQTLVGLDLNDGMIPLYDLVDRSLEGGEARYNYIKDYLSGETEGLETAASEILKIDMNYATGNNTHINIPNFTVDNPQRTLVKDVYLSGQHVAQICNEYIPVINKKERVTVVYPVLSNKVKYNMGIFVGDKDHKPAKVCWDGATLSVSEYTDYERNALKELYLRGSNFNIYEVDEPLETIVEDSYLKARKNDTAFHNYPLVKIFNNIWTREDYQSQIKNDGNKLNADDMYYAYSTGKLYINAKVAADSNFPPSGWKVPASSDYTAIKSTLTTHGISLTGEAFIENGVLGYDAEFNGWIDKGYTSDQYVRGEDGTQTEYLTSDKHHVRIKKDGTFAVEQPVHEKNWFMSVRLMKK